MGQSHPKKIIRGALRKKENSHGWLLTGPFGSGKTTIVRIIAKALACHNPSSVGEACQVCPSCLAIDQESSVNYNEIDAASFGSADSIRDLVQEAHVSPVGGSPFRVIALDEAHVMHKVAQTVLLKTLEDPPPFTHFVLLTTDPHKLLETIRSRCVPVELQPVEKREVFQHLKRICGREDVAYEDEALEIIVQQKYGHVRDALTLAETVALAGPLTLENVKHHLHLDLDEKVQKLLKREMSWEEVIDYAEEMVNDFAPHDIWEAVKRLAVRAELFRLAPSRVMGSDSLRNLVESYGGRLEVVVEWCLGKGQALQVRTISDLVVSLSVLQEQLGTRSEAEGEQKKLNMGIPKAHQKKDSALELQYPPDQFAGMLGFVPEGDGSS